MLGDIPEMALISLRGLTECRLRAGLLYNGRVYLGWTLLAVHFERLSYWIFYLNTVFESLLFRRRKS